MHSRNPPEYLKRARTNPKAVENQYKEWFTKKRIPDEELKDYIVLYIYKNPVNAIFSRFDNPNHLRHVETKTSTTIEDVVHT